jgi:hypothetical protein
MPKTERNIRARARVKVLVDVDSSSVWGPDVAVEQVIKQACHDVIEQFGQGRIPKEAKVIGKPEVTIVWVSEAHDLFDEDKG